MNSTCDCKKIGCPGGLNITIEQSFVMDLKGFQHWMYRTLDMYTAEAANLRTIHFQLEFVQPFNKQTKLHVVLRSSGRVKMD